MSNLEDFNQTASGIFSQNELFLERPRLNQLFEQAKQQQLVTVCAGMGYGKTSAVYSFLKDYRHNALIPWVQLSERDNNEARFWESFVNSLYRKAPGWLESLLQIGMPRTKHDYEKYFSFVRAIYAAAPEQYSEYIFVFDDLQFISNPNVLRFIEQVIRFKMPRRSIFLISRKDPLVILPHLITEGVITGVTEQDLRFTESEIAEYLGKLDVPVSPQGVRDIYVDTQGCAMALAMIGRSLQKSREYRADIFGAMKNDVFKIFEAEIFSVISDRLKNFLIRLSLLDRLPAELLGEFAPDAVIAEMEKQSAYIRYDPYVNTYIIHQLFLSYLRNHQHLLTEEDKQDTYKKAGDYCVRTNYKIDALAYYEKAGDYAALFDLVHKEISTQIPHGVAEDLLRIFENAPAEMATTIDLFPSLHLRTLLSLGRMTEAIELGEKYEKQLLASPETKKNTQTLIGIYLHLGLAREFTTMSGDGGDFHACYKKMYESFNKNPLPSTGTPTVFMTGAWVTSVGVARAGAPEEHVAEIERSEQYLIHALNGYGAGRGDIAAGELQFYRNDLMEAEKLFARGLQKARVYRQFSLIHKAWFYLMRIAFMCGSAVGAAQALAEMKNLLSEDEYTARHLVYDMADGWRYLKLGQPEFVSDWLKSDFLPYTYPKFLESYGNQIRMLHCYTTGNYTALLDYTGRRKERETILFERLESQVIEACARHHMKDRRAAFETLTEAYETAAPNRLITPFIELGADMRALTAAAMREDDCPIPKTWLKSLNRQASAYAKFQSHIIESAGAHIKSEIQLSNREKEILTGISRGIPRAVIAENMGISHNAVKMIAESLYGKIGAFNMADAIRIASEKNLIKH